MIQFKDRQMKLLCNFCSYFSKVMKAEQQSEPKYNIGHAHKPQWIKMQMKTKENKEVILHISSGSSRALKLT